MTKADPKLYPELTTMINFLKCIGFHHQLIIENEAEGYFPCL